MPALRRSVAPVGAAAALLFSLAASALPVASRADTIVSTSTDGKIREWSTTGDLIKTVACNPGGITKALLSYDGKVLATAGADKKVMLWQYPSLTPIRTIAASDNGVTAMAFSLDSKQLVTGSAGHRLRVWDVSTGKSTASFVVGSGPVLGIFDIQSLSGAGNSMIITLDADGHIKIWGPDGSSIFDIPTGDTGVRCMTGNPKQQLIYTADAAGLLHYYGETGQGAFTGAQGSAINCITATRDGKLVVTGGADGSIKVWDTAKHQVVTTIAAAHPGGVTALMVSPDGQMLVSGGADKQARAWTIAGDPIKSVAAGDGAVTYLATQVDVVAAAGK